jgi:hypothetical protein
MSNFFGVATDLIIIDLLLSNQILEVGKVHTHDIPDGDSARPAILVALTITRVDRREE